MLKRITLILALATQICTSSAQILSGGDISLVPAYEAAGTKHLDTKGRSISNVIAYLKTNAGMNAMRVRLFVSPDNTDPSVCQDLSYVQKLGKRIKDEGLAFLLDFHYSDTWADPSSQAIPSTWKTNTSNAALTDSVYSYTKRCLQYLKDNGAAPDYIQIGNEITYGMLWRNNSDKCYTNTTQTASSNQWTRLCGFLNAGAKAVREETPEAKIIIHTERSGQAEQTKKFYQNLNQNKVDYDIIGLSYYPFWHGQLSSLSQTLNTLASAFPETPVQIVETAYYHAWFPSDVTFNTTTTWSASEGGQAQFIKDLISELQGHSNVTGMYYWCPEEAGNGKNKKVMNAWINRGFWWEDSQWPLTEVFAAFKSYIATSTPSVPYNINKKTSVYDLTGRKIQSPGKGIYIKNGKKYVND